MVSGRVAFDVWFGPLKTALGGRDGQRHAGSAVRGPSGGRAVRLVGARAPVRAHRRGAQSSCSTTSSTACRPAGSPTWSVKAPAGRTLSRLFRFRHERTRLDLERHALWADRPRLKVAIAGASGLVGSHLADYLTTAGHRVVRLVRGRDAGPGEIPWDPADRGALPRRAGGRRRDRQSRRCELGRALDFRPQAGDPGQPAAGDADSRGGDRAHGRAAVGADQHLRGRLLRLPRARDHHGADAVGRGVPRRRLPGLGGGGRPRHGVRRPSRDPSLRPRRQCRRRRVRDDAAGVQGRRWAPGSATAPVLVVGRARRPARRPGVGAARRGA